MNLKRMIADAMSTAAEAAFYRAQQWHLAQDFRAAELKAERETVTVLRKGLHAANVELEGYDGKVSDLTAELNRERELHEQTKAALAGETNETEMLQGELDEARARIADLESQLSARADWRPRREMPEGWSAELDNSGATIVSPPWGDAPQLYLRACYLPALAAYLDAEGV